MKYMLKKILHADMRLPSFILWIVRLAYRTGVILRETLDGLYAAVIVKPVMKAIAVGGRRLRIERIPYVRGKGRIELGDDVYISGLLGVSFLKREEQSSVSPVPTLKIGSRTFIGHQCAFAMSKAIEIGEDCMIAGGTRIQDNDGHPLEPGARRRHEKVAVENIHTVVIGNNVWIAPRCTILKGVTIGDNAVVGTGSVVTKDVATGTVVAGVPARVVGKV
jgi:acetyltransferase-like isoleucine patch superfamily enzyme